MKTKSYIDTVGSFIISLIILSALSYTYPSVNNNGVDINSDTVFHIKDIALNNTIYKSQSGNYYEVTLDYSSEAEPDEQMSSSSPDAVTDCSSDVFSGTRRKKAKTSIANVGTDNYGNISELINTLPSDNDMIGHHPPISHSESSDRIFEEKRNAKISNTYIYAIKREDDNDFHIIIGSVPDDHVYFNVENSGKPGTKSKYYKKLKAIRKKFEDKFGELCSKAYLKFNPPIPVEIKGSLFYDIDHGPGDVGPLGLRPNTSWEIHPVTEVQWGD